MLGGIVPLPIATIKKGPLMRDIPLPSTGNLASLRAFEKALRKKQEEIGRLAATLYGDDACDAIALEVLMLEDAQKLPPEEPKPEPENPEHLRVIISHMSNGEMVGGYLFDSEGGTIFRMPSEDAPPAEQGAQRTERFDSWEAIACRILGDVAAVCSAPLMAINRLADLGAAFAADAQSPAEDEGAPESDAGACAA